MKSTMRNISLVLLSLFIVMSSSFGQGHEDVFPTKSGGELMNLLRSNYKPNRVLSYHDARVEMYTKIDNHRDSVFGIYSDYGLPLNPSDQNSIGTLIQNGSPWGINCEHTFPQSKGAKTGNARSDMHHLFPARAAVNEARSYFPFGEIADNRTTKWFFKRQVLTKKPSSNIDKYSEGIKGVFEPNESHKGNVARAMFYFYTMYRSQADGAFFGAQREDLCDWFFQDPVDEAEWKRNNLIAVHQAGKKNPFILDCTLAQRTYCPEHDEICFTAVENPKKYDFIKISPNPSNGLFSLKINQENITDFQISVYNLLGSKIITKDYTNRQNSDVIDLEIMDKGMYEMVMRWENNGVIKQHIQKLIVQ